MPKQKTAKIIPFDPPLRIGPPEPLSPGHRPDVLPFPTGRQRAARESLLLKLKGYTLIAWRKGVEGDVLGGGDWLYALWKPSDGRGWYRSGCRVPESESRIAPGGRWPAYIDDSRASRTVAQKLWNHQIREPYNWHNLMAEAEAFPTRRRLAS